MYWSLEDNLVRTTPRELVVDASNFLTRLMSPTCVSWTELTVLNDGLVPIWSMLQWIGGFFLHEKYALQCQMETMLEKPLYKKGHPSHLAVQHALYSDSPAARRSF